MLSGFTAARHHPWDSGKYCDNISNRILGSCPDWLPVAKLLSGAREGERVGGGERERERAHMIFHSQVVCIYVKAKLDLFIESIKILSLWIIQNLPSLLDWVHLLWGTGAAGWHVAEWGNYVKGVSSVSSWSYEFYLPSRTWLRLWIVKENISLMFSSWIEHSVSWIVAPLGPARGVFS